MTYIIAGIFNNTTFLMTDCVGVENNDNIKKYKYINKINRLRSSKNETYFCNAGTHVYSYAINLFDIKCYEEKTAFNFKSKQQMLEVLDIFKWLKIYYEKLKQPVKLFCRLYFIEHDNIYYYDIDDEGNLSELFDIPNMTMVLPQYTTNTPTKMVDEFIFNNNDDLINLCKNEIIIVHNYDIELKDRFSWVIFNGKVAEFRNSIINNEELVLATIIGDYKELK